MKKKMLSVLLAAAMTMSLIGCGSTADTATDTTETTDATETTDTADEATDASDASTDATDASADSDKTYTVGICQLVQHEALDAATEGFKTALTDKLGDKVTFDEQNAAGDAPTCSTICTTFVTNDYDLILGNATAALQAAVAATDTIPVLGTSITDYGTALGVDDWTGTTGKNISGTTDLAPLDGQADCIAELFPDAKNVGILYCSSEPNSIYQSTTIKGYLEEKGYTVTEYTFSDSNDVAAVTQSACDNSDLIYIPTDNTAASCTEAINNVADPAGVPIFAGEEGIAKGCGVATLSISYYDLGYKTGEMAYDILVNGADISTMEVQSAPNFTCFRRGRPAGAVKDSGRYCCKRSASGRQKASAAGTDPDRYDKHPVHLRRCFRRSGADHRIQTGDKFHRFRREDRG